MDLCCRGNAINAALVVALLCATAGCSDAVTMVRETETSGVVSYLFKEERGGPMGSPHRKEALKVMEKKCPSGYVVLKEGKTDKDILLVLSSDKRNADLYVSLQENP